MTMWYKVIKDEEYLQSFMEMNWEFHDFREEKVTYISKENCVEVFLLYDTEKEGVLIKFYGIHGLHIRLKEDYQTDWIQGTQAFLLPNDNFLWIINEGLSLDRLDDFEKAKQYATWVEAERIIWAVTDGEGNPVEMPEDRINQIWNVCGKTVEKHFRVMACKEL